MAYLQENWWLLPIVYFLYSIVNFLIISCGVYYVLWIKKPKAVQNRQIQKVELYPGQIKDEVTYTLKVYLAMSITTWPLFYLFVSGDTAITFDWNEYPLWSIPVTLFLCLLWHDIYFYITHYLLHRPWMYKKVHYVHHLAKVPTPFNAYSFHWFEGAMQIIFIYPLVLWLPMHFATFMFFMSLTHFFATWGHFNYELMPFKTWHSWWGSWVTTSTHHNLHHRYNKGNLGLYLKCWDIIFGTLNSKTGDKFNEYLSRSSEETL